MISYIILCNYNFYYIFYDLVTRSNFEPWNHVSPRADFVVRHENKSTAHDYIRLVEFFLHASTAEKRKGVWARELK